MICNPDYAIELDFSISRNGWLIILPHLRDKRLSHFWDEHSKKFLPLNGVYLPEPFHFREEGREVLKTILNDNKEALYPFHADDYMRPRVIRYKHKFEYYIKEH